MQSETLDVFCTNADMRDLWHLDYIRQVMAQRGLSASALAAKAGVSSTTLTRALNSPDHKFRLSLTTLNKIRDATGIEFLDGSATPPEARPDQALVPVYDVAASAGYGAEVLSETVVDQLAFPAGYLRRITSAAPRDLAIIGVKGDSMAPTLADDDVVMVDTSKRDLSFDGLFVLRDGGASLLVKRIGRGSRRGSVVLISDNRTYPPMERDAVDIEVVGKVVWMGVRV
jgi:phage repressor protein C with HTH and peptisase S24 domain